MTLCFLSLSILILTKETDQACSSSKAFILTTMKSVMSHLEVFLSLDNIKDSFRWALLMHFAYGLLKLEALFSCLKQALESAVLAVKGRGCNGALDFHL